MTGDTPLDLSTEIEVEGGTFSLAQIAGIDTSQVEGKRGFEVFPKGLFQWESQKGEMKVVNKKVILELSAKCIGVLAVVDPKITPEDAAKLVGKEHREGYFISKLDDVGRCTQMMQDTGFAHTGALQQLLDAWGKGNLRFQAGIGHRKDKNDSDKVYANFINNKPGDVKPLPPPVMATATIAPAPAPQPLAAAAAVR